MTDTLSRIQNDPVLANAVQYSINKQYMVAEEDSIPNTFPLTNKTTYLVSGKRSFEAAKGYPGKKVAVLNFANNHSVGGAPFSAGAQEESLCRCSTLFPCLKAMWKPFYSKHAHDFQNGKLTIMGNDDLIYTPDVIVFKTDERTDPIYPQMMPEKDWYKVGIITCAAPELRDKPTTFPSGYEGVISKRIKRILDVASQEKNEVLILGAWGCGAFGNSIDIVAKCFMELLPKYGFETVEFALSKGDGSNNAFAREIEKLGQEGTGRKLSTQIGSQPKSDDGSKAVEDRFCSILEKTGRQGIDRVLEKLKQGGFFSAPASVYHHGRWEGGLSEHSLKVYDCAMKLRAERLKECSTLESVLPEDSVAIAALLHDVCKFDQYMVGTDGKAHHKTPMIPIGGHGSKSVILLLKWGLDLLPNELLAIRWHMGKGDILPNDKNKLTSYTNALNNYPLVKLIVNADYDASH